MFYKAAKKTVLCFSTSCGGMSNETVRRSTFTKESVHGRIKKIPVDKQVRAWIFSKRNDIGFLHESDINLFLLTTNDIANPRFFFSN